MPWDEWKSMSALSTAKAAAEHSRARAAGHADATRPQPVAHAGATYGAPAPR